MSSSVPVFGKRNASRPAAPKTHAPKIPAPKTYAPTISPDATAPPEDYAAFFAAARAEMNEVHDKQLVSVPLSFKSAFLAGLVVGCGLVGFDLTGSEGASRFTTVTSALGLNVQIGGSMLPAMILLGLIGGARTAAMTVILVHGLLGRLKLTSRLAYAAGGAAAAACLAGALHAFLGHAPTHGWIVDLLAGGAGGLLYRAFAGTRRSV